MASSGSSSVINSRLRVRPIEGDDELVEASMDLLQAHVRLIMARILTMEESKPILLRAFFALGRFGLDHRIGRFLRLGGRLESLLGRRERVTSSNLAAEAAHQITQEQLAGLRPGWSEVRL